jgi:hypothetical protein
MNLEKLKDLLPKDLNLKIHAFTEADEEINFKTLNSSDAVHHVALSFATPGLNILLEKNVPMIFYQQMYAGHTWAINPLRRSRNVILFMGSNIKDLVRKIKVLYTFKKISQGTRYILVAPEFRKDIMERKEILEKKFNFKALLVKSEELMEYYNSIPVEKAEKIAVEFISKAIGVVEPSKEEVVKSCRLYLAMKKLMEDKKANAITIVLLNVIQNGQASSVPLHRLLANKQRRIRSRRVRRRCLLPIHHVHPQVFNRPSIVHKRPRDRCFPGHGNPRSLCCTDKNGWRKRVPLFYKKPRRR